MSKDVCLIEHEPESNARHPQGPPPMRQKSFRRLKWTFGIAISLFIIEVLGSWLSGSLALLADAFHVIADAMALGIALIAGYLAERPQSSRRSYGYYRLEVLAALLNGIVLCLIAAGILRAAYLRFQTPVEINAAIMFDFSVIGLLVNILMLVLLKEGHSHNLNIKGAYLHVLGDTLSSVAVIIGAALMRFTGIIWIDSLASTFVACMIIFMALRLLWDSSHILLEGTPKHLDADEIEKGLREAFPSIVRIHDFHIWEITAHLFAMTAHVEATIYSMKESEELIHEMNHLLLEKYGIKHTTFQIESIKGS